MNRTKKKRNKVYDYYKDGADDLFSKIIGNNKYFKKKILEEGYKNEVVYKPLRKKWNKEHKEKHTIYMRTYQRKNREKINAYHRAQYQKNKEKIRAYQNEYYARKRKENENNK